MIRIILFLGLIALAAAGAAWIADQTGDVALSWGGWRVETTVPVFALALGVTIVAAVAVWSILRGLWRTPARMRRKRQRTPSRPRPSRHHARPARDRPWRFLEPRAAMPTTRGATPRMIRWRCCCTAQSAQLEGDREGAQRAFRAMAEREDTRLLGLRGLFVEAQRADDPVAAVMIADEALKLSPSSTWASHAVLGFRCARGDWNGALSILDNNHSSGLIDKATFRRQRGVLLTARALELEKLDRDLARESVDGSGQAGADAGAGRGARQQVRERGASGAPRDAAGRDRVAGAAASRSCRCLCACKARRFRAAAAGADRDARGENAGQYRRRAGGGARRDRCCGIRARPRSAGAVHRPADAARGRADGGDRAHRTWRFRPRPGVDAARGARAARSGVDRGWLCQRSLAAGVAGHRTARCLPVADAGREPAVGQGRRDRILGLRGCHAGRTAAEAGRGAAKVKGLVEPQREVLPEPQDPAPVEPAPPAAQDNSPQPAAATEPAPAAAPEPAAAPPKPEPAPVVAAPLFRARQDIPKAPPASIPAVIPIVRAPDDPGVDDEAAPDEFSEQIGPPTAQAGGWRGFLSRWGS